MSDVPDLPRLIASYFSRMPNFPGIAKAVQQVRLGNTIRLRPVDTGQSLDCYAGQPVGPAWPLSTPKILQPTSILRVTASDLEVLSYQPGSWVLSIDARPITNEAAAAYPGTELISPLVARITLGTGAAAHFLEIDAISNVIALPAIDVAVEVGFSQVLGLSNRGVSVGLFSEYEFTAVLHKTTSSGQVATRSFICYSRSPLVPIPKFSKSWCYVANLPLTYGTLIGSGAVVYSDGANVDNTSPPYAQRMESIPADIVASNARLHCFRDYHPLGTALGIDTDPDVPASPLALWPGTIVNQLDF